MLGYMTRFRLTTLLLLCCCASVLSVARADDAPKKPKPKSSAKDKVAPIAITDLKRDKPVDFQAEILPILRRNCMACHNTAKAENHLVLETPQTIVKGGESGPAVEPKHGADSLLLKAAAHLDDPTMPPPDNNVKAVALTPDELGLIKLWIDQGATGQVTSVAPQLHWRRLPATVQPILATAVSPDGDLAVCGRGSEIYVYELSTNSLLTRLVDPALAGQSGVGGPGIAHLDIVQALAFAPGGDLLASSGFRDVKLWQRSRNVHQADLTGSAAAVRVVTVSKDGARAATGDASGQIRLWELPSGKPLATIAAHTAAVTGLRFLPDGSKLISSSLDKTVHAWNVPAGSDAGKIETPAPINALTLVRGGTQVCTGHADNVIRIWPLPGTAPPAAVPPAKSADKDKTATKPGDKPAANPAPVAIAPLKELKGHSGPVTALETFTPDSLQILSGSDDGTVRGWNIDNGQQTRQVGQGAGVTAITVRPDGHRFASAGANNSVHLWNADNNQPVVELRGDLRSPAHIRGLEQVVELARGKVDAAKQVVTDAEARAKQETEAVAKAKDAKTAAEKMLEEKKNNAKGPLADKASSEKDRDAAVAASKMAADKLAAAKTAADKDPKNKDLAKAFDDAKRAAAEAEQKVTQTKQRADDIARNAERPEAEVKTAEAVLAGAVKGIESAEASAKKAADAVAPTKAVVDAADKDFKQATAALETARKDVAQTEKTPRALAFSPDNLVLAVGGDDHLVQLYSAETGQAADVLAGHGDAVLSLAFTSNSGLLAGAADKQAIVWNTRPGWSLVRTIGTADDPSKFIDRVLALDFSPDGKLLATGGGEPSRSGELKIWNVADGSLVRSLPDAHSDAICSVRFSPDGTMLASSATDRFMKVWTVATGALVKSFEGHTHHVLGVAWKADGKVLASCGADNVVKVWNLQSGDQLRTMEGFGKEVTSITFIGASPRVLLACGDHSVRLYNVDGGNQERGYGGANDFLYCVAATPDGRLVVAGGQDSVLRVWNVDNGQPVGNFDPPK